MEQLFERIEKTVDHPLFQGNDRVLRDRDRLGTDLPATGRDVAISDIVLPL